MEFLNPKTWRRPKGYSNGVVAKGRLVFVAGHTGWKTDEQIEINDFAGQVRQILKNTLEVLAEAGAGAEHITRMTWYVTDKHEYMAALEETGAAYRDVIGAHFPAMTMVQVMALMEAPARVEIETTAVVPEDTG